MHEKDNGTPAWAWVLRFKFLASQFLKGANVVLKFQS
jgi:hypothetical protein